MFENLLPSPCNEAVLDLLFVLATWHAYAKLRLHTETTLGFFEKMTTILGREIRNFKDLTGNMYETRELPQETTARGRRKPKREGAPLC